MLFGRLQYEAGSEAGARARFQMLVTDLVGMRYPAANEVAGPGGGDWGIDTYVGRLDDAIVVWQSKFFPNWKGENQRGQVRKSFNDLMRNAANEGFHVDAWTLCVPCILSTDEQRWWDTWAAGKRRKHKIRITLWNGIELRRQLLQDDAGPVRREYFPSDHRPQPAEPVAPVAGLSDLGGALFVRQLHEAGQVETDAARGLFFAAEALARDLASRGNHSGVAALNELHLDVQALWETRFNARVPQADSKGRIAGLIEQVLKDAAQCPDPEELRLRPAHRKGVAHRLVENQRAGWVRHWREIAANHEGPSAADTVADQIASLQRGEAS